MEAQFAQEKARRLADYTQKQADQQEDFNRQRDQQKQEFQARLAAITKQAQDELAKLKAKNVADLRALDTQYASEKAKRLAAYVQQLADLDVFTGKMKAAWAAYYAAEEVKAKAFFANINAMTPGATPGRAGGGYVDAGLYRLHSGEYVLNPATTRQAERFAGGGQLTQGGVLAAMGGGGMMFSPVININGLGIKDLPGFRRLLHDELPGELANALQRAKGNVPL
jgi:hypothetical protein